MRTRRQLRSVRVAALSEEERRREMREAQERAASGTGQAPHDEQPGAAGCPTPGDT